MSDIFYSVQNEDVNTELAMLQLSLFGALALALSSVGRLFLDPVAISPILGVVGLLLAVGMCALGWLALRDLPERQRTLRATVDWGYALLDVSEQLLLGRLVVFAGGWPLDAAEQVVAAAGR